MVEGQSEAAQGYRGCGAGWVTVGPVPRRQQLGCVGPKVGVMGALFKHLWIFFEFEIA